MQIQFSAYAEDCTVSAEVELPTDRLSDFLAATTEFMVDRPAFRALDDGHVVEADSAELLRDDLCLVVATGPRGRLERRIWTRQHPVRARVGPYIVIGYLHAPPTIDPFRTTDRRAIVALTDCLVGYSDAGRPVWIEASAVLLNTGKIELLESASEEDLGLAQQLERATIVDAVAGA
jgi:hypothetical protein